MSLILLAASAAALRVSPASLHRPAVARSRAGAFAMQAPTAEDEFGFGDGPGDRTLEMLAGMKAKANE